MSNDTGPERVEVERDAIAACYDDARAEIAAALAPDTSQSAADCASRRASTGEPCDSCTGGCEMPQPAPVPEPERGCETCEDGYANGMRCQGVLAALSGEEIVFPCPQYVKEPDHG